MPSANREGGIVALVEDCGFGDPRIEFVRYLSEYMQIDVFGTCGNLSCPSSRESLSNHEKKLECLSHFRLNYK